MKEHDKLYAKYEERTEQGREMFDEIKSLRADYDAARRQLRELTEKHEELLCSQIGANTSFKRKKVASERVFEPAQRTMRPLPVQEPPPSTVRQSAPPLPIAMAAPAVIAPPQPVASTLRSADPYTEQSDDSDDELTNPRYWKEVKDLKTSPMANLLTGLARDFQSRNHAQQGRELQINPRNEAEFKLVMDHLDIHHDERLLAAAHKHVSELQAMPSRVRSQAQKSILRTWMQPSWVKHKTYDKTTRKVYFSEKTIDEVKTEGPSHLQ